MLPRVAALGRWLPRMLMVARSIPYEAAQIYTMHEALRWYYHRYITIQKVYAGKFKLKFSALLKAYEWKNTENSKKKTF